MKAILASIVLLATPVLAQESPKACSASGDKVVCTREGFDKLVKGYVDVKAAADKCVVELEAERKAVDDRNKAMVELQKNTQDLAREHRLYIAKSHLAVASAVLGTALMGAAAIPAIPGEYRVVSAVAGLAGTAFSVVLIW
jgi:hypothetical protein